jgi:hypothetical protein
MLKPVSLITPPCGVDQEASEYLRRTPWTTMSTYCHAAKRIGEAGGVLKTIVTISGRSRSIKASCDGMVLISRSLRRSSGSRSTVTPLAAARQQVKNHAVRCLIRAEVLVLWRSVRKLQGSTIKYGVGQGATVRRRNLQERNGASVGHSTLVGLKRIIWPKVAC